ncbi:MAG: M20/M25/M40 family metallo-hydrolase [Oscillospiraceae bacterium]|nr:M20/M25/M40 family metallo-hydrolase [Oscillospiraceae bacterium]
MLDFLKSLCGINGISGNEQNVSAFICAALDSFQRDHKVDALGNVIAQREGAKVTVFAHMDEVGFLVRYITEDGLLLLRSVGAVLVSAALGARVTVGKKPVQGVIGMKPVHLLSASDMGKLPAIDSLYADIGASSREEAQKLVSVGDAVHFERYYCETHGGKIMSPALDDRAGCALLMELLRDKDLPISAAFTVQEEIGARGAATAAYAMNPEIAIVLEATTAADIPDVAAEKRVCEQGKGAAISFMDNGTLYDRRLFDLAFKAAREQGLPVQAKSVVAGGTDAGAIHKSRGGVRCLTISLPCRYIHSPCAVIDKRDIESVLGIVRGIVAQV